MANERSLQDSILNSVRKDRTEITVFLTNGFQFDGKVEAFDNYTVLISRGDSQSLVFKHAISTVIPHKNVTV